jgi:hypothetical protein
MVAKHVARLDGQLDGSSFVAVALHGKLGLASECGSVSPLCQGDWWRPPRRSQIILLVLATNPFQRWAKQPAALGQFRCQRVH